MQLFVDFPDGVARKAKKLDVEMMMRRKLNRVKKEYQVYMHKVHVLCWLAHGNYVSKVLNDTDVMAAILTLVPSKECYPGKRIDMKYVEQITTWYKDKLTLKQDKSENKYKPKAPPLKEILQSQVKSRNVTTKKYLVFLFVCMLRALGLQCRVMFNFVTLPLKPPQSELCSLSTKSQENSKSNKATSIVETNTKESKPKCLKSKSGKNPSPLSQVDGNHDYDLTSDESEFENIMQVDGNDDTKVKTRSMRPRKTKASTKFSREEDDVSPPKVPKLTPKQEPSDNDMRPTPAQKKRTINKDHTPSAKEIANDKINNVTKNIKTAEKLMKNPRKTRSTKGHDKAEIGSVPEKSGNTLPPAKVQNTPTILITDDNNTEVKSSKYFENTESSPNVAKKFNLSRKRSATATLSVTEPTKALDKPPTEASKTRTKSAPGNLVETSKYFTSTHKPKLELESAKPRRQRLRRDNVSEDAQRVSHRDIVKAKPNKIDVTGDLVNIIKSRVKEEKQESKKKLVKGNYLTMHNLFNSGFHVLDSLPDLMV